MVWNMYDFFTMYAEVDGWEWSGEISDPSQDLTNPLDTWIVSRVHQLTAEIEKHMDLYDIPNAVKPILPFIEDASNWYVRRSRRRFWKSDDDSDKNDAYRTLHYVLVRLSIAMAPFTPFLAEELYQKLTGGESVHLLDWPATGHIDELSLQKMEVLRTVINQGLSARAQEKLKIRQPLASVHIEGEHLDFIDEQDFYTLILHEELNVHAHSVHTNSSALIVTLDTKITPELKREGMMREVVRNVQSARKAAGLNVDDRIHLAFSTTDAELRKAIEEFVDVIVGETLAKAVVFDQTFVHETSCSVESAPLTISLEKAELS
jgi:isoleucyl-tRNA synthetase